MAFLLSRRRAFAIIVLVLVALLYYRPLDNYFSSRAEHASRVAELAKLERQQAALKRKLREASSPAALAEEERLLGFVRPGDQLFIVKDISQWRRRQNASRHGH
jgi:cell division protein FtsB